MQPLVLHHLEQSRARRIVWLLEELQVPYVIKAYQRDPKTFLAPKELRSVHPLGKSPLISDPNHGNRVLAESGAIVEYIIARYGKGRLIPPENTDARLRWTYWLHYAEGSLMPLLLLRLVFNRVATSPAPFFVKPIIKGINKKVSAAFISPELKLHLGYIEQELAANPRGWFAGDDLTAADIQMSYPLEMAMQRAGSDASKPSIAQFLDRIHARPAYQRACEVTGETWKT
jgi:glutathione S-transferase